MGFWNKKNTKASNERGGDPRKEVELLISELEGNRETAMKELLSFKTSVIKMESDVSELQKKSETWEKRAMLALKKGDEELAKTCLKEKKSTDQKISSIEKDMAESARYASDLNESRKEFEKRLRILKLKKGTLVTQIGKARGKDAFDLSRLEGILESAEEEVESSIAISEATLELAIDDEE